MAANVTSINGSGGLHIPNYLLNSRNGTVVHPIMAGAIYGPVHFPSRQAGTATFQPPQTTQNNARGYPNQTFAGYGFK